MYKEIFEWIKKHVVPVACALLALIFVIVLAVTENPGTVRIEPVAPILGSLGISEKAVSTDISFKVISSIGMSQSMGSEIMGNVAGIIGGNVEAVANVTELLGTLADTNASQSVSQFTVPMGAVEAASFAEISVYYWTKTSKNYIPLAEHREGHVVLKLGSDIIDLQIFTVGAAIGIQLYHIA